ncbi:hypothetical protein GMRT_13303 [Giardia muris]|uniref:Uncharacterized protein n=1 Tax=Giardia muris TaxID=5742 RepID=A0A4Z1SKT5_GIAMU|nr:hypothetical protein GMRT_13303 [Giardia muris]|eukprot:TNJ26266.1 hypothetical protein GMRT_13303 [Giardia muris]
MNPRYSKSDPLFRTLARIYAELLETPKWPGLPEGEELQDLAYAVIILLHFQDGHILHQRTLTERLIRHMDVFSTRPPPIYLMPALVQGELGLLVEAQKQTISLEMNTRKTDFAKLRAAGGVRVTALLWEAAKAVHSRYVKTFTAGDLIKTVPQDTLRTHAGFRAYLREQLLTELRKNELFHCLSKTD